MTIKDFKNELSRQCGVPVVLLTGITEEDCINQAKALCAFKDAHHDSQAATDPQTAAEKFVAWFDSQWSDNPAEAGPVTEENEHDIYIPDSGEVLNMPEPRREAQAAFADWFGPGVFVTSE